MGGIYEMKYRVGIVILNYYNWSITKECINSIMDKLQNINFHIYLVDNASPNSIPKDYFNDWMQEKYTFVQSRYNKGYAAGNNIGIKMAVNECDYIMIANSDIIFIDDSIEKMITYMENQKDNHVGIVAPALINADGILENPSLCIKTTLLVKYCIKTPLKYFSTEIKNKYYGLDKDKSKPFEVYSVHGSCFMVSNECAQEVFPFDEHTFLYEEESILGVKMEEAGFKSIYFPSTKVIHKHGQSTKMVKAMPYICICESEIYYLRKYVKCKRGKLIPLYLYRVIGYLLRCLIYKEYRELIGSFFDRTLKELKWR